MTYDDLSLETEEYITAEEYLRRRANNELDPAKLRYAFDRPGFYVKLDKPRYRVGIEKKPVWGLDI